MCGATKRVRRAAENAESVQGEEKCTSRSYIDAFFREMPRFSNH